ncbi:MAG: D-alanyl-D-alanine carboxypeptidase [Candidatus Staskawiczbacteria bacterium]|nr:D-alanyl-D-alanine carboxypeptidase [Candidatus Staskawiczbacteria bacterium]
MKLNTVKHKAVIMLLATLVILIAPFGVRAVEFQGVIGLQQRINAIKEQIGQLKLFLADLVVSESQINERALIAQGQGILAESYLVVDISDNSILLQKNASQIYPIASITKLMNAVITVENVDLEKSILLKEAMLKPQGTSLPLYLNLNISAKNLLKASLIQSSNDAAESLTYFLGNEKFIGLMNKKAKDLGMESTAFYDAHGVDPLNRSTATDIVKLISYIQKKHPEIFSITKDNDFWLADKTGKALKFQNLNQFYFFPEFIGGKVGYLVESKQTFASLFNIDGKTVAIVLLYSKNRRVDTLNIMSWIKG